MTNTNVVLKRADEQEKKFSQGDSILKKLLPELGYELFVGKNFDNKKIIFGTIQGVKNILLIHFTTFYIYLAVIWILWKI